MEKLPGSGWVDDGTSWGGGGGLPIDNGEQNHTLLPPGFPQTARPTPGESGQYTCLDIQTEGVGANHHSNGRTEETDYI